MCMISYRGTGHRVSRIAPVYPPTSLYLVLRRLSGVATSSMHQQAAYYLSSMQNPRAPSVTEDTV